VIAMAILKRCNSPAFGGLLFGLAPLSVAKSVLHFFCLHL
jgi:hypothetical protein